MTPAEIIVFEAMDAFNKWVREHDPDGDMDILQQAEAYGKWCAKRNELEAARSSR